MKGTAALGLHFFFTLTLKAHFYPGTRTGEAAVLHAPPADGTQLQESDKP